MKEVKYCDLKYDDLFKIQPDKSEVIFDLRNGRKTEDRRVFKVTPYGALQITDCFGDNIEERNYKIYPYLTMPVYVEED